MYSSFRPTMVGDNTACIYSFQSTYITCILLALCSLSLLSVLHCLVSLHQGPCAIILQQVLCHHYYCQSCHITTTAIIITATIVPPLLQIAQHCLHNKAALIITQHKHVPNLFMFIVLIARSRYLGKQSM